jgi:undecaprenyl diphosphate synthase
MGFNREVLQRRRDTLNGWGVRIRWAGRRPKLWAGVIQELQDAEKLTAKNKTLTLTMCVNYGGRIELVDAMNQISQDVSDGKLRAGSITEKTVQKYLQTSAIPDVDLFLRSSGEQRTSNFLLWQSAYAEFSFDDTLWPDFRKEHLWQAIEEFGNRSRRFGKAIDSPKGPSSK